MRRIESRQPVRMRLLALILVTVLVAIQGPLWFGKGGWLRVRDLQQQVDQQKAATAKLEARTKAFDAEVRDLKTGVEALEERARSDLGMIKQDEVYFQLAPRPANGGAAAATR
jgi:cell division protein FtsB